ncbi:thioredoxin domain-containing protein [Alkaliphilus sp. MSJ-5]|uniref:Thioredoxin domain-containing protein n=1 Tax=Alkaliphilus flagellatus TaxID=2841507 RepID=A0ABS6FYV4_9FIRM|nr:thioredoxin domain-containing protein [Alkaliphilus flagellatus]MBU5675427.1 thioredoxin domain-containing protein [Alkaliphilus flagellatus]
MPNNKIPNRLINEKSPYLLQHAYNPVDWYPWGEEALEKAKEEDKPIFLSIGYSTCHWCHVMERESFEDEEVAQLLNENFIAIKVDREERPDIDNIYMTFCQALTGHGGWPLTVFITPDQKPFYAGTYFPKNKKYGHTGLMDILTQISKQWKDRKDEIIQNSKEISEAIAGMESNKRSTEVEKDIIHKTFEELEYLYDPQYGGFGKQPKFPTPHNLSFLLKYWSATKEKKALEIVENTLKAMYKGGMFDHVGYGFARYSVDRKWLVPHFEKMLYDNAMLSIVYLETYHATRKEIYKEIAEKLFEYVLRDMTSPLGGFYSAEDADSEGIEGKFYVWTVDKIEYVLGKDDAKIYCKYYDITNKGNFEGHNIPNLINQDLEDIGQNQELKNKLEIMNRKLFDIRNKRVHPHKDDKILTSWNGLMIAAMAYGYRVLGEEKYLNGATDATEFIFKNLIREDGRLLARYRDGHSAYLGYIDDYAFLIWGLLELYEATLNEDFLEKAIKLNYDMIKLFWDENDGGFYLYGHDAEQLVIRPKEVYDGAIPSGNSVAALNMLRLASLTGDTKLEELTEKLLYAFGNSAKEHPNAHTFLMTATLFYFAPKTEVVIVANKKDDLYNEMIMEINNRFMPFTTVAVNINNQLIKNIGSNILDKKMKDDITTAHVCSNFVCHEPTNQLDQFIKLIDTEYSFFAD